MKNLTGLVLLVALMLLPGCAITHEYGPYTGTVVDKETGEPIEGAVVFMSFYTGTIWAVGGRVSHYADAVEVLTDAKGEFNVPPQRVFAFHPGDTWDDEPSVIIFKPGYGAFPGHRGSSYEPKGWFRAGVPLTIKLPNLKTKEERSDNAIRNLWLGSGVPENKFRLFEKLKKSEFNYLDKGD